MEDFHGGLVEPLGIILIEGDVEGVFPIVLVDDDVGHVVGVAGNADTLALPEGVVMEAAMGADGLAPVIDDGARPVGDVFGEELVDIDLAEEADALAVPFSGIDEAMLMSDFADLGFGKLADGEEGAGNLRLAEKGEKIALVLVRIAAFEEGGGAVGEVAPAAVMPGGDALKPVAESPLEEDAEFHIAVAEHIGVGGNAIAVSVDEVIDDGAAVFPDKVDDLEGDAELVADGTGVFDILLGGAAAEDIGFIHPNLDVSSRDVVPLFLEQEGGDGAVHPAGHGDKNLLHRLVNPAVANGWVNKVTFQGLDATLTELMTERTRIQNAYWETERRLLIQLKEDWVSLTELPPLFLGPALRPFGRLERVPIREYGKIAHYYVLPEDRVCFVLDAENVPQLNREGQSVYVAGSFNGWGAARGDPKWKLTASGDTLELKVPLRWVHPSKDGVGIPQFKFVTGEGQWIAVSLNATNLIYDPEGNANYALRLEQTGRHLFFATLAEGERRSGEEILVWAENGTQETYEIPSVLRLLDYDTEERLGAWIESGETVFRLFAPRATRVEVRVYEEVESPVEIVELFSKGSGLWEGRVDGTRDGHLYHYHVHGVNRDGSSFFDPTFRILDPYARSALGSRGPGIIIDEARFPEPDSRFAPPAWHDLVILECHLEDLVAESPHREDADDRPGYRHLEAMLRDETSYLRALGINAIELQPLQQSDKQSPGEYHWGYMTTNFFSLEGSYAKDPRVASQIEEFGRLVQAAHDAGIAVILDVVYNHVGEPAHLLFIDKYYYFRLDQLLEFENWSGCGNDLRCEAPMVRRLILDSLLYLVRQFDLDGFRFDLAELIGKEVLEEIAEGLKAEKPSLILIAEPWSFRGHIAIELKETAYSSWNDGYRNFIRDYVRGWGNFEGFRYFLGGSHESLASWPAQTVNYAESHDDRCWLDMITENAEHNGFHPQEIDRRRTHLMVSLLLMSLGIPMLAAGQDFLRSKHGVNNTYQRGDLNALDYQRLLYYTNSHRYFRNWIRFRQGPWGRLLRLAEFPSEGYLQFFTGEGSSAAIVIYNADGSLGDSRLAYAINPHLEPVEIACTTLQEGGFRQLADTERIRRAGLTSVLLALKGEKVRIPGLSAFLWVSGDPEAVGRGN